MFHGYDYSKFTGGTDLERAKTISGAVNFIMDREKVDDKDSFVKEALMLHQALSLCSSLVDEESRFEAAFFESVRVLVIRLTNTGVAFYDALTKPQAIKDFYENEELIAITKELADTINAVKAAGADVSVQSELLTEISALLVESKSALKALTEVTEKAAEMEEGRDQAVYYRDEVKTAMDELRAPIDKLEMLVDKSMWPMPSYGDLLFEV